MYNEYDCCDTCIHCTYDSISDCYICDLTDDPVDLHNEACDEWD